MPPKFIKLRLRSYTIVHGYDDQRKEILEEVKVEAFADKLVAVDRIKSVSEKFILTDYADGRWIYWEYEGGLAAIAPEFERLGLLR